MSWFLMALAGPLLYACTNHIDKHLLEAHFKEGGVGTLILFSSLLSALALPPLLAVDPGMLSVDAVTIAVLSGAGILNVLVLWCYLRALQEEEASVTVIFYQLVPVFGYVLGYLLLGEELTLRQLGAMAIIIVGTAAISFEIGEQNSLRLRRQTIVFMVAASFFWALESVALKAMSLEENVWRALFWEHVALVVTGIVLLTIAGPLRAHFLDALRVNSKAILLLNVANETLFMLGNAISAVALLLAPVALILLGESYQPIFVLAIGVVLAVLLPGTTRERLEAKHLWQKLVAILVTGSGTYLLLT